MIAELLAAIPWQALYDVISLCTIVLLLLAVTGLSRIVARLESLLAQHAIWLDLLLRWRASQLQTRIALGVIETKGPLAR